jgi:HlyD family secretion protein
MLLGQNAPLLHVRVDIDETDAWRLRPGALAVAFVRGNPELKTPLQFVRIEPYVLPKVSLTGQTTERTDTRVLQVIYSFEQAPLPVYVGQQLDVFIQAPPAGTARLQHQSRNNP